MTLPAEIDLANAEQVREDLLSAVAQGASQVIADMTATTFCDSAGITALVRVVRQATADGSRLRLASSGAAVPGVLAVTGIDGLMGVCPSVAAALASAGGDAAVADPAPSAPGQAGPAGRAPLPG